MKRFLLITLCLVAATIATQAAEVPSKKELRTMAEDTFQSFGRALKAKDFTEFYEETAKMWQKQTTAADLKKSFTPLLNDKIDLLGAVEGKDPLLTPPAKINSDGVLLVEGYYPTAPNKIYFTLKYLQEEEEWKLIGINVKIQE